MSGVWWFLCAVDLLDYSTYQSEACVMFVLNDIERLPDDLLNLPENTIHKLTFKAVNTIKEVPDSFTGIVYEDADGQLVLQYFNAPKGNVRKIITLKNKLPAGVFEGIKRLLFATSNGKKLFIRRKQKR